MSNPEPEPAPIDFPVREEWEEEPPRPEQVPSRRIGRPVIAWVAILFLCGVTAAGQMFRATAIETSEGRTPATVLEELQARILVGMRDVLPQTAGQTPVPPPPVTGTSVDARFRAIILTGELAGPEAAMKEFDRLHDAIGDGKIDLSDDQEQLRQILDRLYWDYEQQDWAAKSVSPAERRLLRDRLGWFGELALAPRGTPDTAERDRVIGIARRSALAVLVTTFTIFLLGLAGAAGLILLATLWSGGVLSGGLRTGSRHGAVYAETFAVWLFLFIVLNIATSVGPARDYRFLVLAGAMVASLIALAWPIVRGVSWREVRQEIGWLAGRNPALEPVLGVASYAMAIPVAAVGLVVTLILLRAVGGSGAGGTLAFADFPVHPIIVDVASPDWTTRLQILFVAAVVAPIVEETMFRGVLYRHLREATGPRMRAGASAFLSATIVSFLFAAIHPQGFVAIPALMALAYVLNMVREWRETLIPGMIAHGINNAVLMTLLILVLG